MKNFRLGTFIAGVLVIGGTMFVSSTFAGTENSAALTVVRHTRPVTTARKVVDHAAPVLSSGVVDSKVVLVAPPSELPANLATTMPASAKMVTSTKAFAPPAQTAKLSAAPAVTTRVAAPAKTATAKKVTGENKAARASKVASAKAPAQKADTKNLFTLVRMLNYSPHPLDEDLLRQSPLALNGNNYWFTVKYDEDWKVISDEEAYMNGISFEISVMENNQKVRSLKTPKVAINPSKIKKGQVLGIAEVAPYKFTISVEEFTKTKKGISELVFKLDLLG
ncbi:MAG: hypothetical protein CVV42_02870 [Candidatus Riflebacteria bacterium HGW-Riflebacteria-2]|nr:MAG: hypothetical protein CVV42_02870 [Candidatus Riflebacteria bacterium HGW-Riflebacteria-2]